MSKWLVVFSLILSVVMGLTIWDAYRQEFPGYQKAYFNMVELNSQTTSQQEWARNQRVELKQQNIGELRRLDRCQTCHLAVENPGFTNAPEPLRTHPSLLDSHPPEKFGCAVCHGGNERGTTTSIAHGETEGQNKRLLKDEYIQATCYACHTEKTLPPQATGAVIQGKIILNVNMCLRCHQINGEGGNEGPDLSEVGSRRDWMWTYAHFINPQAMNLVSTMPRFQLSRDDIKHLTIFLLTLQNNRDKVTDNRFIAHKSADPNWRWPEKQAGGQTNAMKGANLVPTIEYEGKELFTGAGCKTCHTIGQSGGEVGPALSYIARKYDRDTFVRLLRNPADVFPQGLMPQLNLNEKQVQAVADYLSTLK